MNRPVEISTSPTESLLNHEDVFETEDQIALKLSSIEELTIPSFEVSSEAEAMMEQMDDLTPRDRYVLTTLDLMRQKMDWMIPRLKNISREVRKTNGTCIQLKTWKHSVENDIDETIKFSKKHKADMAKEDALKSFFKNTAIFLIGILGGIGGTITLASEFFSLIKN